MLTFVDFKHFLMLGDHFKGESGLTIKHSTINF
jgi:hypothetical protein